MAAEEQWNFPVTIPAGTPKSAPLTFATTLPTRRISRIHWMVPPGPSGQAGWQIRMNGVSVIPVNGSQWIIHDGDSTVSELARLPDSGAWSVAGYNTGTFTHTIYVSYFAAVIAPAVPLIVPMGLDSLQPGITSPPAHH
jgi:hypothetical protein